MEATAIRRLFTYGLMALIAASTVVRPLPVRAAATYPVACRNGSATYLAATGKSETTSPLHFDLDKLDQAQREFVACFKAAEDNEDVLYAMHGVMLMRIAHGRTDEMQARFINLLAMPTAERKRIFGLARENALKHYGAALDFAQEGMKNASQGRSDWSIFEREAFWLIDNIKAVTALDFDNLQSRLALLQLKSQIRATPAEEGSHLHSPIKPAAP
ncbi:MAG: hypothetical protein QOI11_894 [Candidatus Eremiobacteraeota bacterium]|nr:hypothetical protein [Candidatus Eremiobacteraeota bacterium]